MNAKSFRPMYIFTILAILLVLVLYTITHANLNPDVNTILTTVSGGLLTLLGTVVNYEFGSAKPRESAVRSSDASTNGNGNNGAAPAAPGAPKP